MSDLSKKQHCQNPQTPSFIKEVANYFMNFLETDFKKRRIPKRNSIQKVRDGHKVAIDLDKYPSLKKFLFNALNKGFPNEKFILKKAVYTAKIPNSLLDLIEQKINELKKADLNNLFHDYEKIIKENYLLFKKEHDKYLEEATEQSKKLLAKKLIQPFLDELDKPLENLELADDNSKYQLEVDLSDTLFACFADNFQALLQNYAKELEGFDLSTALPQIISLEEIKDKLNNFFKHFAISDAFYDFYQLFRNNKLMDKTGLYLYFYEIALGSEKFPVFYLPLEVSKQEQGFAIKFDQRIFVNTKAIEFVVQEHNLQIKRQATLAGEFERIIYLNEQENFTPQLTNIITKIENFFELNRNLNIQESLPQKGLNLIVSLSNKSYFYLFDKSDESLINDYEEILNNKGLLLNKFSELLKSFVEQNPPDFTLKVNDEWLEKSIPDKLVFASPIPLNDEQKQVLMALAKPDCKFLVLEGPPGTGKSHTITAIICQALLEEKSVLVLSDKKEALDVVEEKISQTLNKIRHEDDFQNPILRLGRSGNKFNQIVQGQAIQKIREHYQAYKAKKNEYSQIRTKAINNLKSNLQENINYFAGISLADISNYFAHHDDFAQFNWIERENLTEISTDLPKLFSCLQNIAPARDLDLPLTEVTDDNLAELENIGDLLSIIRGLKEQLPANFPYSELQKLSQQNLLSFSQAINELLAECKKLLTADAKSALLKFNLQEPITALHHQVSQYELAKIIHRQLTTIIGDDINNQDFLSNFIIPAEQEVTAAINELKQFCANTQKLKKPVIGYLLKNQQLHELSMVLKKHFHYFKLANPQKNLEKITKVLNLLEILQDKITHYHLSDNEFKFIFNSLSQGEADSFSLDLLSLNKKLSEFCQHYPDYASASLAALQKIDLAIEVVKQLHELSKYQTQIAYLNTLGIKIDLEKLTSQNLDSLILELEEVMSDYLQILELTDDFEFIKGFSKKYSQLSERIGLPQSFTYLNDFSSTIEKYSLKQITAYLQYKKIERKLEDQFSMSENDLYTHGAATIERLVTAQMTHFLDKRIIEYTSGFAGDVNTLKNILKKKQKFPKELFKNLKKAFPCILAGIRDYAEYIPLEKDLFDLIIIDEASQVSVAQSLPALIRGKQIVVLGDDKQFSNVKANNASKVTNQELKQKVQEAFLLEQGQKAADYGWLTKVKENFDIKNSILKFVRFIRNYQCQLKKHFRCYPEIISYSDKYFYGNSLQCMKVRGVPIEEVIKFEVIEHDGKIDKAKNTNELEAKHLIKLLKKLHRQDSRQTLGIITPHREQVNLLFDKINELPERDWLFNQCQLKIMTFDTCQGEERDLIFYSMVATREKDRLNWIFPVSLAKIADEFDGTTKSQRLNVGFSRAKNCLHFILSKPPEEFKGEIKNALLHYQNQLEYTKNHLTGETDPNSPMEDKIKHYFEQTNFYKTNRSLIEFKPQFPLGDYLKQLDSNYHHPKYKVDFLLLYKKEKIIIEYDGFKEHFSGDASEINQANYQYYLNEEDLYRQKVLEGYGYKFLRLNKFNLGKDPIATLDERLKQITKKISLPEVLADYHQQIEKLINKEDRTCEKCERIYASHFFPYKNINLCLCCYEKDRHTCLHKFRANLDDSEYKKYRSQYTGRNEIKKPVPAKKPLEKNQPNKTNKALQEQILQIIGDNHGIKARNIASILNISRAEVNSLLYGRLKKQCRIDSSYHWHLKNSRTAKNNRNEKQQDNYRMIATAMDDNRAVTIRYKGLERTIHPYALDETYCAAYCTYKEDMRNFRLDRMTIIEVDDVFVINDNYAKLANQNIEKLRNYRHYY